jgi:hypothetical protein
MQCGVENVRMPTWMIGMDEPRVDRNQISKTYGRMVPLKLLPSEWNMKT